MNEDSNKNEFGAAGSNAEEGFNTPSSTESESKDGGIEAYNSTMLSDETNTPVEDTHKAAKEDVFQEQQPGSYQQPSFQQPPFQQPYQQTSNQPGYYPGYSPAPHIPQGELPPKIVLEPYKEYAKAETPKGFKIFALVLSLLIIISGCLVGGYFLGKVSYSSNALPGVSLTQKPTNATALSAAQVYNKVNKSIVGIAIYNEQGVAANASGVIYSSDGYIVTNDHIYADVASAKFKIYTFDGKEYDAKYVAGDTRSDLAVLKMEAGDFTPAVFGDSLQLAVGEDVVAIGRPSGATENSSISEGIVAALNIRVSVSSNYSSKFIQTDSAINPGSSGGALSNMYGQVVGITSSKLVGDEYDSVGFAIPTVQMKPIIESLLKNGSVVNRARLGITYREVDSVTASLNKTSQGLYIVSIDKTSGLYGKSVKEGDIITQINGKSITSSAVILDAIEAAKPGDTVKLTIKTAASKAITTISVKLLADKGSSSYSTEQSITSGTTSDGSQKYNSSQFNFPKGN